MTNITPLEVSNLMTLASIKNALEDINTGVPIIVVDEADRENEGD